MKEEEISDDRSERDLFSYLIELKQSTAVRVNTLDVGVGSWFGSEGEDRISKCVANWDTYSVLRYKCNTCDQTEISPKSSFVLYI